MDPGKEALSINGNIMDPLVKIQNYPLMEDLPWKARKVDHHDYDKK